MLLLLLWLVWISRFGVDALKPSLVYLEERTRTMMRASPALPSSELSRLKGFLYERRITEKDDEDDKEKLLLGIG